MKDTEVYYYYECYSDYVYRIAFVYLKHPQNAEDVLQNTFLKLLNTDTAFNNENHIKNWLLKVAVNEAKNYKGKAFERKNIPLEDVYKYEDEYQCDLYYAILSLPEKLRLYLLLYYYETWSVKEIAKAFRTSESYIQNRLMHARKMIKKIMEE